MACCLCSVTLKIYLSIYRNLGVYAFSSVYNKGHYKIHRGEDKIYKPPFQRNKPCSLHLFPSPLPSLSLSPPLSPVFSICSLLLQDALGQDLFLIGPPGPQRRHLALAFCELLGREMEYVSLSRDTTETDLKQRREIVSGTVKHVDQVSSRTELVVCCMGNMRMCA